MKERVQASKSMARCPYCHDDLKVEKDIVACAPCGARHHRDCHAEHGRCASCGAEEALYPRDFGERRIDPPRGSKITVSREDEGVVYRWDPKTSSDIALIILLCIFLFPLGLYMIYRRKKHEDMSLELSAEALTMRAVKQGKARVKDITLPRAEVDRVRVTTFGNTSTLMVDHGVDRYILSSGVFVPALSSPEIEWLAEQIEAWIQSGPAGPR